MRIWTRPVLGNSLETTRFFVNRSMTSRVLLLGLPLLTLVLLLVFLATGRSIEAMVNRAIARNAQLHAQAMSLSLEQILTETRNQLLILAAGSMEPKDMVRRLQFRVRAEGLRYREVAFMGTDPSQRYLLLSYGGEIISIPPDIASATVGNPFTSLSAAQRPGHVQVSQPLEVVYSMVPLNDSVQSIPLYVIRFSTPIYDSQGVFQGMLILSLDLTVLRDAISMFSSSSAPLRTADDETRIRSIFFDNQGWMLFQSENLEADDASGRLNSDSLRAGFQGEFGRAGFSTAFRPGSNHVNYWSMVSNVQSGHSGQIFLDNGDAWGHGDNAVEGVSFAPVTFTANPDSPHTIVGGLAVLDTSFTATRTGIQIIGIYGICLLAGICLLGLGLAWLARGTTKRLRRLSNEVNMRIDSHSSNPLVLPPMPRELEQLKDAINALLHRLRRSEEEQLNQQLMQDARWAREPAENMPELDDIPENGLVGTSAAMQDLRANFLKAAPTMADVLVIGETGTGKELVSAAIHQASPRANGPFITINCGALDENLLMDTLFGHVKGAFTEARQPRKGAFLTAEGGTLMLDEIGNAAPKVQQALLRALSTRMIRPLGSDEDVPFDTRIIAATNAELLQDAQEGSFREDLYYRLAVITIRTPPLRRRKSDLPLLAVFFLTRAAESQGLPTPRLSRGALRKLQEYHWPGNVRELQNCLTRALAFCENGLIFAENIQLGPDTLPGDIARPERGKLSCPPARADSRQPHGEAAETAESPVAQPVPAESEDQGAMPAAEDAQPRLNARLARLLPQIVELGSISRQEYQDMAGKDISMRTAQYDLQILVRLGLVRREGRGPAQRYIVLPAARGFRA
ncbi:sigma 54-interacting transcriptional regulator [Desulfovibrio sp. SGI.082]|uniref:Sigma 54-interacting transcriptional regulator n=2 Tax=Desulfovibrio piger TaxID=901 RepID=A0A848C904_9BACT|nr:MULTISPECIES: sigma 54-interacting transcriptional regulator [Desulfovibrio]MCI6333235.1 sigma 54-interacting transcriptional regulator [Desulfovibrio piger]MDY5430539.1 sigma 54-interacting transcriptional regulator [Desulfovibrio sp.]NME51700.1 sigma 54-interacting transcriptional regulator [Desulfovibrio piger]